jgi:hypothetical protein
MSASPAPEIAAPAEREELAVAMVVIVVLHAYLQSWGVEGRSSCRWSNDRPWRARPTQEEQGVVVPFPTNSNATASCDLSPATSAEQPDGAVTVTPSAPPAEPVPFHSGPQPPPGRRSFSLDVAAPCLDSAAPVATRPDVGAAGPPRSGQTPRSVYQAGPSHLHPSVTASPCWYALVGRNAIAWSSPSDGSIGKADQRAAVGGDGTRRCDEKSKDSPECRRARRGECD